MTLYAADPNGLGFQLSVLLNGLWVISCHLFVFSHEVVSFWGLEFDYGCSLFFFWKRTLGKDVSLPTCTFILSLLLSTFSLCSFFFLFFEHLDVHMIPKHGSRFFWHTPSIHSPTFVGKSCLHTSTYKQVLITNCSLLAVPLNVPFPSLFSYDCVCEMYIQRRNLLRQSRAL